MKAFVFNGPLKAGVVDVPVPSINDDEVLVKVNSCAICGTDIRTLKYGHLRVKPPRIIGHEFSGTIADTGKSVKNYSAGDKVIVVPGIACGRCYYCRNGLENLCESRRIIGFDIDGGFAEYVKIPSDAVKMGNVKKISDKLSLEQACLIEPFTAVYNAQKFLNINIGYSVAIIGGGPIGLMHAVQSRYRGASKIVLFDLSEERCKLASKFDINYVINSSEIDVFKKANEITNGYGFDVVIVCCVSGAAQNQALKMVKKGGRVCFFAGLPYGNSNVTLDSNLIHYKQISVLGANGSGANEYDETIDFLENSKANLSNLISGELPLDRIEEGFEMVRNGLSLKVIIHP